MHVVLHHNPVLPLSHHSSSIEKIRGPSARNTGLTGLSLAVVQTVENGASEKQGMDCSSHVSARSLIRKRLQGWSWRLKSLIGTDSFSLCRPLKGV